MATMEKPLQKKKKKKQQRETEPQTDAPSVLSLDFSSTATKCEDILSHDCFVSAEFQPQVPEEGEFLKDNVEENTAIDTIRAIQVEEICFSSEQNKKSPPAAAAEIKQIEMPIEAPSAPVLSENLAKHMQFLPMVKYPDLNNIRASESQTWDTYERTWTKLNQLKAFTESQLQEIYYCREIELAKQFELEFLTNALQDNFAADPLYNLLMQYSVARKKIKVNVMDIKVIQENFPEMQKNIWKIYDEATVLTGVCGDNLTVTSTVTYEVTKVDARELNTTCSNLRQIHELAFSYINNLACAEMLRLKIEQMVREILSYQVFAKVSSDSSATLHKRLHPDTVNCIKHLRRAISILFSFTRKHTPDKGFLDEVKGWLTKLVALYIRIATKEDHWFLLFHILRCPGGVASWAAAFLQIPKPTVLDSVDVFTSPEINHCVAVMYILLLPVKKRNEFLQAFKRSNKDISDPVKEDLWILIDSDGEEGSTSNGENTGLREGDLVALLNQIPFETLFKSILNLYTVGNDYKVQKDLISGNYVLKLIAFNSVLVQLLGEGLITYNMERYKQFAKRLGRLIRHCVQYISDIYELYMQNNQSKNPNLCERLDVEFNSYVLKSCSYIYKARNLGAWQYFSSLPFAAMSTETTWQLLYYLNVGFPNEFPAAQEDFQRCFESPSFMENFNVAVSDVSPEDIYYLLQAFFEMATERQRTKDWDIIQAISAHIFNIGFINESTRDICYKTSRDLLINLTSAHPDLISVLLHQLKKRIEEVDNAIYLFKSLPLGVWKPTMDCFECISYWLLNYSYETTENVLSRIIISRLEWGFDSDNNLFLPRDTHIRMACLICEASNKHAPEVIGLSGISESVRQISNFMECQTTKEQFLTWCWNMMATFHIHLMDQNRTLIQKILQDPATELRIIPDLKEIDIVFQGVSENRPLSLYLAILASLWGHSIPLIYQRGFPLLRLLLNDYRHATVIRCIQLICPLFLDSPESLVKCESFQEIIKVLLTCDRTYIKMAKNLIAPNAPGPILELLVNMLQSTIIFYTEYGLQSPTPLISLWLQVLTNINNWQNMNALFLIDTILKIAYQFPDAWYDCKQYFQEYYKDCVEWKSPKASTFKMLLGGPAAKNLPISADCIWLSLLLLEIEHEVQEQRNRLWPELLRQIAVTTDKTNLDNLVKKTTSLLGSGTFSASQLVLYKYANLISSMDVEHPLFVIVNQKFFGLYLARVPFQDDEQRFQYAYGVADKFYEYNISLMKKIKTRLKQAEEYYLGLQNNRIEDNLQHCYAESSKIMKTFLLWLEETSINKISKDQNINLPPQFNIPKLTDIFEGNEEHWTEFIHLPGIRKIQREAALKWSKSCFRNTNSRQRTMSAPTNTEKSAPLDRIKSHLLSYDKEVDAPKLFCEVALLKPIFPNEVGSRTLFFLAKDMKILKDQARKFNLIFNELNALNGIYKDLIQNLYVNARYRELRLIRCTSLFSKSMLNCAKPAEINAELQRPQKNEVVQNKIELNRNRHDQLVDLLLNEKIDKLEMAMLNIEHIIKCLAAFHMDSKESKIDSTQITEVAVQFFFDIIKSMDEDISAFTPINEFCSNLLLELGIIMRDNQETQGIKILDTALRRPELLRTLSDLFVPSSTGPVHFLNMYKFLIESHLRRCDSNIIFVLISKFDLQNWLQNARPRLSEINRLLKLVVAGLENWNRPGTTLLQDLFRRHLIHIFEHEFPEHYGEVLQVVLTGCSEQKLMPEVLLDLFNSLLNRSGCESLSMTSNQVDISEAISTFATQQQLFSFKEVSETIILFARHFQTERLQHGLHGLYPKHKKYCIPLSIWFSGLSQVAVVAAIIAYPGVLADQICDWISAPVIDMYSPWLVTYTGQNVQQSTANWIRHLIANGRVLLPWSDLYIDSAQIMLNSFVKSLQFILESLPVSGSILGHVFTWYAYHFTTQDVGQHIRAPIHGALVLLPWERFNPMPTHIEMMKTILNEYLPECHSFLGHIFLRTNWNQWMKDTFSTWNPSLQTNITALILTIFVQISFEPNTHDDKNMPRILKDAFNYPWHLVEYQGMENIFNWLVASVEPAIILKIPSESNEIDINVLELLKIASGMKPVIKPTSSTTIVRSKRILFTQSYVRLLRACATKHQKLLNTKEGLQAYEDAIVELVQAIEETSISSNLQRYECEVEAQNLIVEVITSLPSQGASVAKLFVEALIVWQSKCRIGSPVLCQTLNAFSLCKSIEFCMYSLLEATIYNYFQNSEHDKDTHLPTWEAVLKKLGNAVEQFQLQHLLQGPYLLSLHCYILYKIRHITDQGERITFLQDLSQLLENIKTNKTSEAKMAIIWGAIISCGCRILETSDNAKKPLLMLARYFQVISTQSEGWGEGLLGAIGIKRDSVSNKRKILTRCLSCIIFSLFPDRSSEEMKPNQEFTLCLEELKTVSSSKKYGDVKLFANQAIAIVEQHHFPKTEEVISEIYDITKLLYNENFFVNLPEVWNTDNSS